MVNMGYSPSVLIGLVEKALNMVVLEPLGTPISWMVCDYKWLTKMMSWGVPYMVIHLVSKKM